MLAQTCEQGERCWGPGWSRSCTPCPALPSPGGAGRSQAAFQSWGLITGSACLPRRCQEAASNTHFPAPVSLFSEEDSSHDKSAQRFRKQAGLS